MTEEEMQELAYRCENCGRFAFIARIDDKFECDHCETIVEGRKIDESFAAIRRDNAN